MNNKPVILLGVTGGIAAFKAAALTSLLTRAGMDVRVVMTKNAAELVSPRTFQALSKNPVYTDMFSDDSSAHPHIDIARQCCLMCVAPATANFLGKAANGIADDLLSTTVLAFDGPIILAPAMNEIMWQKPAVKRNVKTLAKDGFLFVGPETGRLSCGESGVGRMSEPEQILQKIQDVLSCIKS
ncbi:MAG: phosphopantothenoylcysteine decarboxylase [Thermoguttaceae bacterium]|nr:phosphopantothenoylcysteine decarboxylase [Thermoguttaceae bacterium]